MPKPTQNNLFRYIDYFLVGIITIISLLLLPKFSNLLINADSYAIMLPVEFLSKYGGFSHQLGEHGDFFSPLFYRGGFSLVIYLFSLIFGQNYQIIGQSIIQFSYVSSAILVYFTAKKIFSSELTGFFASMLLVICFIFTEWSTVLMSEIPTIFLVTLALTLLLYSSDKKNILFILSALVLGIALAFRVEMILLFIPFIILIHKQAPAKLYRIPAYIFFTLIVWLSYIIWLYFTHPNPAEWFSLQQSILSETLAYHQLFVYSFILLLVFLFLLVRWPYLAFLPIIPLVYFASNLKFDFFDILPPFYSFLYHDLPIIAAGIIGFFIIRQKSKTFFLFFSLYLLPLLFLYFSRAEYRYYVHLILPLLLLASYFLSQLLNIVILELDELSNRLKNQYINLGIKIFASFVFVIFISGQIYLYLQPSFLPPISYEQVVIENTQEIIKTESIDTCQLLVCSVFSEAFYYSTHVPAQDCFDGLEDIQRNPDIPKLVIVEEDIARHQPDFATYMETKYPRQLIAERWVVTPYIEKNITSIPHYPIRWYLINSD
ncbi:glycosyltransferase family 39 protein [Patescibacteria group bacterium]|nr:glycosyltransferase family 39 protein [Patescibacteria group bacterium]